MNPSQICLPSNYFATFVVVGVAIIFFALWQVNQQANHIRELTQQHQESTESLMDNLGQMVTQASRQPTPHVSRPPSLPHQRLVNPLLPPLQSPTLSDLPLIHRPIPVNVPTRGEYQPFQQIGFAHKRGISDQMFPIFGRSLYSNKYEYYVVHPFSQIKIPIKVKGDWELNQGDRIHIAGFPDDFEVEIYDQDQPRYIPY